MHFNDIYIMYIRIYVCVYMMCFPLGGKLDYEEPGIIMILLIQLIIIIIIIIIIS